MAYGDYRGPDKADKGKENGSCNRGLCQCAPARWYNHGSFSWYCDDCKEQIDDSVGRRLWAKDFPDAGHPMLETRAMMTDRMDISDSADILDWNGMEARSGLGNLYEVQQLSQNVFVTYVNGTALVGWRGTIEKAKAAAQTHHGRRWQEEPGNLLDFQSRVALAHPAIFHDDPTDIAERAARYFEEASETVQAFGMSYSDASKLLAYTFSRPTGDPAKEIGASLVTLASLCVLSGHSMVQCGETDLRKFQKPETVARIRAKRSTRHGRGPLPGIDPNIEKDSADD